MNSKLCKKLRGILIKGVQRGSIALSEKSSPPYVFHENINPFKGLNFNINDDLQNLIKYVN